MTVEKIKSNKMGFVLLCTVSLFLVGCLLLIFLRPWDGLSDRGSSAANDPAVQQSNVIEISRRLSGDTLYEQYGSLCDIQIFLQFGRHTELLTIDTIADWVTADRKDDGSFTYTVDDAALGRYTQTLADRYSNFENYIRFTSADGTEKSVINNSIGWIFDDTYAAEQLRQMILDNHSATLNLTDKSEESNRWWHRVAADYDTGEKASVCYAEVSIDRQHLWVHKDGKIILESPVITGNPSLGCDTPTGAFVVLNKQEHATLYGPGYETEVDYWIGFSYAIGFHDAVWQNDFGGKIYLTDGSHGCVNMPLDTVTKLYDIAYVNMPVYVY